MRKVLLFSVLLILLSCCLVTAQTLQPQILSRGMKPVTESMDAAAARDGMQIMNAPMIRSLDAVPPVVTAPQIPGNGFAGINLQDEVDLFGADPDLTTPPDTMGAIGPKHFVEAINDTLAIYDRAGVRQYAVKLSSFFAFGSHPLGGVVFNPRVIFDRASCHWFISCLELGNPSFANNNILLAVSRTSDPTGVWDKYVVDVGEPNNFATYDTLGVDDNGVYFGLTIFDSSVSLVGVKIIATDKRSLISSTPGLGVIYGFGPINDMHGSPQPAYNMDKIKPNGLAWFVSSDPTTTANVRFRYLVWTNTSPRVPTLSFNVGTVPTPNYATPLDAPAPNSVPIEVDAIRGLRGDVLMMAVIRNGQLYTCRHVGVDGAGGVGSPADRDACEWIQLNVTSAVPTLVQSGRVFDNSTSGDPLYYYYPSLMVNGQNSLAMSFSGSNFATFVSVFTCGRLVGDLPGTMGTVETLKSGVDQYQILIAGDNVWGRYSYSSLDPNDDQTMWTIQEYAEQENPGSRWGTWINSLLAPPPTLDDPAATVCAGKKGVLLKLTGTGFFDPDSCFPDHLKVDISGNGISNIKIISVTPTCITVKFDVAANATPGPRDITVTNPDGQSVTVIGGLTIIQACPPTITCQPSDCCTCLGGKVELSVVCSGTAQLTYQWKRNGVAIPGATSSTYDMDPVTSSCAAKYSCCISNTCGSCTSREARVSIISSTRLKDAKKKADGEYVCLDNMVVTFNSGDYIYVEDPSDKCGICVAPDSFTASLGDKVRVYGRILTNSDCERYIEPICWICTGTGTCAACSMQLGSVSGGNYYYNSRTGAGQRGISGCSAPNCIGSLVCTTATCSYVNNTTCLLTKSGVTCYVVCCSGTFSPSSPWTAKVTGIASCGLVGGKLCRVILVADPSCVY